MFLNKRISRLCSAIGREIGIKSISLDKLSGWISIAFLQGKHPTVLFIWNGGYIDNIFAYKKAADWFVMTAFSQL